VSRSRREKPYGGEVDLAIELPNLKTQYKGIKEKVKALDWAWFRWFLGFS
jgi:hypothetical protein